MTMNGSPNGKSSKSSKRTSKRAPKRGAGRVASGARLTPMRAVRSAGARKAAVKEVPMAPALTPVAEMPSASDLFESVSMQEPTIANDPNWVELFPQGISVGGTVGRPVLILKDQHGVDVLPVWMNPIDAGVALAELSQGASGSTPHAVTRRILQALDLKIEACVFVELIGHHQFVLLKFAGHPGLKALRVRADEAMSFSLQARAKFYSTREYMARCRDMDAELTKLENGLAGGTLPGLQAEMEISSKKHPYVI